MNIQSMSVSMEKYVMPLANKLGNEIHLRAIRDAYEKEQEGPCLQES